MLDIKPCNMAQAVLPQIQNDLNGLSLASDELSSSTAPTATVKRTNLWPEPYYLENGLRRVKPYFYTYNTSVKERWRNRELLDVFASEFRDRPVEFYRRAMEQGLVQVNGKTVGPHHVLKNGEYIQHRAHRHEPPVTAEPVQILHEDDELIVINKPSGVPVHSVGRYHHNSVLEIMKSEREPGFKTYPCNRLDRLTSGVMFVGKSPKGADRICDMIRQRTVRKEYIARVAGEFPDGEVVCDQPILSISPKLGLNRVRATGKPARTVFKRLAYYPYEGNDTPHSEDGHFTDEQTESELDSRPWRATKGYSIVRCRPVTGRTHQIRVHLQFLGHPIENDPIYANRKVWGFDLGRADADAQITSDEDVISRLSRMGKEDVASAVAYYDEMVNDYEKKKGERMTGQLCDVCDAPLYQDPSDMELSLWLHSLRYEDAGGAWRYTSPMPVWAKPPEGVEGLVQGEDGIIGRDQVEELIPECCQSAA